MKTTIFQVFCIVQLLFSALLNQSSAQGPSLITDIPVSDAKDAESLRGKLQYIPGEQVEWIYAFQLNGKTRDGSVYRVVKNQQFTLLGVSSGKLLLEDSDGTEFIVHKPANVYDIRGLVKLLPIELNSFIGIITKDVVINRLGNPNSQRRSDDGGTILNYTSGIRKEKYTVYEDRKSTQTIYDPYWGIYVSRDITTSVPVRKERQTVAYDFDLQFTPDGKLLGIGNNVILQNIAIQQREKSLQ